MICIGIAFVFWLMTKLSYTYKDAVVVKVSYETPDNKVFTYPPVEQLEVDIQGKGWDLLGLAFSRDERKIEIDINRQNQRFMPASSINAKVMQVLPKATILNIHPENIPVQIEEMATKTVPVVLDEQIRLAPLYQYADSIKVEPQTIQITGPASVIRTINEWKTTLLLPPQEVTENIDVELALAPASNNTIKPSVSKVRCTAGIEAMTEKEVQVPIQVLNAPDSLLLVILPKKINVSGLVGLSDYDRLRAEDFRAVINFDGINLSKDRTVRVQLRKRPDYVHQVQYQPKNVDYIIRSRRLVQ